MGIVLYILFYNRIFAISFDESFLISAGIRTDLYNLFIAVITAVIIVLAMNLVGSLLISALIIFPAVSSMKLFNSFKKVTISSAIISVLCALTGIIIARCFLYLHATVPSTRHQPQALKIYPSLALQY